MAVLDAGVLDQVVQGVATQVGQARVHPVQHPQASVPGRAEALHLEEVVHERQSAHPDRLGPPGQVSDARADAGIGPRSS